MNETISTIEQGGRLPRHIQPHKGVKMSNKTWLTYPCAACGGIAIHDTGPHILDNGTRLYCNICGGETVVVFQSTQ